jgi:hypothetical protein
MPGEAHDVLRTITEVERDRYKNMLKDLLAEISIVFDDERLDYVDAQVTRSALKEARELLKETPKGDDHNAKS